MYVYHKVEHFVWYANILINLPFLDCFNGTYGAFCVDDCPANCKDNTCQKDNGNCLGMEVKFGIAIN